MLPTWPSSTSFRFILLQVLYTSYYWHVKWIYDVFHLTHLTSLMLLCQFLVCDMQLPLILIQWINLSIGAMMKSLKLRNPKWMEQVFAHYFVIVWFFIYNVYFVTDQTRWKDSSVTWFCSSIQREWFSAPSCHLFGCHDKLKKFEWLKLQRRLLIWQPGFAVMSDCLLINNNNNKYETYFVHIQ